MAWDPKRQYQGGELMIDHRASPGLPEDIARSLGIDPAYAGEGKLLEHATLTCAHCKCAVVKNPLRTRERPYCSKCDHYICDLCAAESYASDYIHISYEKKKDIIMSNLGTPTQLLIK